MKAKTQPSFEAPQEISQIKIWLVAARLKTLTAGVIPVLIGVALARAIVGKVDWIAAFLTLACSILIQIGINLINDVMDFKKGADNDLRIGFKRVVQSGLISPKTVLKAGLFCFALALLFGIPLIFQSGWLLLFVLLISISLGYMYTGGPFPLAYYGLGDIFAFIFFGLVITVTAFYVQTGFVDYKSLLAGAQIGCLATVIMAINNFRDIACDAKVNKRTLAVLFGPLFCRLEITIASLAPFMIGLLWGQLGHPLAAALPCLALPFAWANIRAFWSFDPSPLYNQLFIRSTFIHLLFGILLILGYLL